MTVRRGETWGESGEVPEGAVEVLDDATMRHRIEESARLDPERPFAELGVFTLRGGDLWRTLGGVGPGAPEHRERTRLPVDVVAADLDGVRFHFVAHLVARRLWWATRTVVAMNAAFVGSANLGPRAHPNDGLLDVTDGRLPLRDVTKVRERARAGVHLPHPDLRVVRVRRWEVDLGGRMPVWLDGERVGRARHLVLTVIPDAITVVV